MSVEPVKVKLGSLGSAYLTPERYLENGVHVQSADGGLLYKGYLYTVTLSLVKRDDMWHPRAECDVAGAGARCTIPKRVKEDLLSAAVFELNALLTADPQLEQDIKAIRIDEQIQIIQGSIEKSKRYRDNYQKELDNSLTQLNDLLQKKEALTRG